MKKSLSVVGVLALLFSGSAAFAQGSGHGTNSGGTNLYNFSQSYSNHYYYGEGNEGHWYTNMARWSGTKVPQTWTNRYRVVGANQRGFGPPTPEDVQALVRKFQVDREAFMAQQREMKRQMDSASEQERQQLKEQLKEQMQEWQRLQTQLREQLCEQADRLRDQLRDHERLIERVSNPGTAPVPGGSGNGGPGPRGR